MILAGDIGGTNARLAYFQPQNGNLQLVSEKVFPSREHSEFGEIVEKFLKDSGTRPDAACFGIAGPVRNGRVETSNLPWVIEQSRLAKRIDLPATLLINDLEANAWGIGALTDQDIVAINKVSGEPHGNQAVIAAGTGLGQAGLVWDGSRRRVFACEGGHCDFAPQGDLQIELLRYLEKRFGHVSYERILSGPGLVNVYEFLREQNPGKESPRLVEAMKTDAAAAISKAGLDNSDPLAAEALDIFVSVFAAEAGNLALKIMATGGIFLSGGIAPKILPKLTSPPFMDAFLSKGRLRRSLMEAIPVRIVINEKTGLLGAARCAALQISPTHS